ncbi:MAG: GntR family transcriptional regulator [Candidatus Kaistia colombiensis]|nr:MAG: GntR family transcriptional regulator [Kaistia sp.]
MVEKNSSKSAQRNVAPVDAIHSALLSAILSQDLLPGSKLNEEAIGSFFNVSRTIVRAALTRLNAEAVIELKQNRGAFVASPSIEEARNVFEARICIEREIIQRLARQVTPAQVTALLDHNKREHVLAHSNDRAGAIQLAGDFHIQLAQLAGNDVLTQFLKSLITRTSLILALYGDGREHDCSADEHHTIIEALKNDDSAGAIKAMTNHLDGVLDRANLGLRSDEVRDLSAILERHSCAKRLARVRPR